MSTVDAASGLDQHATMRVLLISAAAALGGFLFGFDTAVINGAVDAIRGAFGLSAAWIGFAVSCTFPALAEIGLTFAYGVYAGFALLSLLFVVSAVRETKGMEVEDMRE